MSRPPNNARDNARSHFDTQLLFACGLTFLLAACFAIYRFIYGEYLISFFDSSIAIVAFVLFIQTWFSIESQHLRVLFVIFIMTASTGVIFFKATDMIFWAYPSSVAAYLLLSSRVAAVMNLIFISIVISQSFNAGITHIGFYTTILLVGIFGFIFSRRSEQQTDELVKLATVDCLTEVKNRRSFNEKMQEVLAERKRSTNPVCLLILDLDFFKRVNDEYGHSMGDEVLYNLAQRIKCMIRDTDYFYRFGGEEFVMITTNTSLENAGKFADEIRNAVAHTPSLSLYNVTVSIGVTEINQHDNADSCFRRADLALYQAKSKGRNRVYTAANNASGKIYYTLVSNDELLKISAPPIRYQKQVDNEANSSLISQRSINLKHKPGLNKNT